MTSSPTVSIGDLTDRVWARKVTVLVVILLGLSVGGVAMSIWPVSYTATALVQVSPITSAPFSSTPVTQQVNIVTERNVLASPETAEAVVTELDLQETPHGLLEGVEVTSPPDSTVLRVSFSDGDPRLAAAVANTFADQYLQLRFERANDIAEVLQAGIEERITALMEDDSEVADPALVQQQVLELRQEQARLAAVGVDPGKVIGRAAEPSSPSSLSPLVFLVAGGALGALIGLVAALAWDTADPHVQRPERVGRELDAPVVLARGTGDEEAALQLTLHLLQAIRQNEIHIGPAVVCVLCPDRRSLGVSVALQEHLRRTDHSVVLEALGDESATPVERGFPADTDRLGWSSDVYLLDVSGMSSPARQAMVLSRSDLWIVVTHRRTTRTALRYWSALAAASSVRTIAAWYQRRLPNRALPSMHLEPRDQQTQDSDSSEEARR